jgi:hypothetical protein
MVIYVTTMVLQAVYNKDGIVDIIVIKVARLIQLVQQLATGVEIVELMVVHILVLRARASVVIAHLQGPLQIVQTVVTEHQKDIN